MGEEQQQAFRFTKVELTRATTFVQPDSVAEFVPDTEASGVAISGILHQCQGPQKMGYCDP